MERTKYLDQMEEEDIMRRMQQSDDMQCNNIEYLQFSHKRENELMFMAPLSKPLNNQIRNVTSEYDMWTQTFTSRVPTCTEAIAFRGGNNRIPIAPNKLCAGFSCFGDAYTQEYVVVPCKKNTFKNYVVEDDKKICSSSHQLFNNMTKRV